MVYSEITMGLGNQLFQYAAGRALALRLGTSFRLNACFYRKHSSYRALALNRFRIQAEFASRAEQAVLNRWDRKPFNSLTTVWQRLVPTLGLTVVRDPGMGFDERILALEGNIYLRGYWESWRYFPEVGTRIREELTLHDEPDAENRRLIEEMQENDSVGVHVRRGDSAILADRGGLPLEYYVNAAEMIQARVPRPHFYIFSDDPEWTRANIKLRFPTTYVSHNTGTQDHEDLRLMTECKHFITGNSTFSWWGAWLGDRPGRLIFTPKRWFRTKPIPDLVPDSWIRV
jgi:hypothetical protein